MWNTKYVTVELCTTSSETPDVFGFGGNFTQLFEIKTSHADFVNDKKKKWRNISEGMGEYRTYVCPTDIIKEDELPEYYGLLYYNDINKSFSCIKRPEQQPNINRRYEILLITSVMRRENIKAQIFNYR